MNTTLLRILKNYLTIFLFVVFTIPIFSSCGGESDVIVSWDKNPQRAVNTEGGGYVLYLSRNEGFNVNSAEEIVVSYDSASGTTPTSIHRTMSKGTWYVRMKAFGNPMGGARVESPLSEEFRIEVR